MRFIAIIPARYASTRFPGKPLALIGNKPMIQLVYERVKTRFPDCFVATDDVRIADAVRAFGGEYVMTSADHRSGTDRCREALDIIERQTGTVFDFVVNVQGDEPFISDRHLEDIRKALTEEGTTIATLVREFGAGEDPSDVNSPKVVFDNDFNALYFSRSLIPFNRASGEIAYYKHIGLYGYRSDVLREITELGPGRLEAVESLEQLRWLENGYRIKVGITQGESIAVDTPADLERALRFYNDIFGK